MGWNNFWSGISYLYARAFSRTDFILFIYTIFFQKTADWLIILYHGSFFDYVDKILAFFDHLSTSGWHLWMNQNK